MKYHFIPVTILNQNCSVVWCDKTREAAIIDPGGSYKFLCKQISKLNVKIKKILLTHGHWDHVGAAIELAQYYSVPILGPHQDEQQLLEQLPSQCLIFNVNIINKFLPNRWLIHKEIVMIGNEVFRVLHCPGHSPGHIVFWNKENKFIVMGDVLFKGSIGRTDLPGGNKTTLINSINNQILPLGDDILFLPGHGVMSTIGDERKNNFWLK